MRRATRASCAEVARCLCGQGLLPLEFKPAHWVGDLLTQHLDDLEEVANNKGGVMQTLADHLAKVYRVNLSVRLAA
jgi:hypothetical protein